MYAWANSTGARAGTPFQRAGDRTTSSGASSEPSEESPIGEEVAAAVAEEDDDDEVRNMSRRG